MNIYWILFIGYILFLIFSPIIVAKVTTKYYEIKIKNRRGYIMLVNKYKKYYMVLEFYAMTERELVEDFEFFLSKNNIHILKQTWDFTNPVKELVVHYVYKK